MDSRWCLWKKIPDDCIGTRGEISRFSRAASKQRANALVLLKQAEI